MSQLREIAQLGMGVLRCKAKKVQDMHSAEMQQLVSDLFTTLANTNGVGIAAPQISESWRIMIIASRPSERYPYAPEMEPTLMINPSFEPLAQDQEKDWEGCLSIPGIRALVPRYENIKISFSDQQGKPQVLLADGFIARIFQHEYDHLNGLVYLDRVEDNKDIISESEFQKLMASNNPSDCKYTDPMNSA
ncbi:MAG: peptide deformylase [Methyloprofundus sp.]|nr:peptide deformylase [Methyloprofundus sp.]